VGRRDNLLHLQFQTPQDHRRPKVMPGELGVTNVQGWIPTLPSSTSMSMKPHSLEDPAPRCLPSATFNASQPPTMFDAPALGFNSDKEQHPTLNWRFLSPTKDITREAAVAAWLTISIRAAFSWNFCSTVGTNNLRNPSMRLWISSTVSPLRDGYQMVSQDGSISEIYSLRDAEEPGRG